MGYGLTDFAKDMALGPMNLVPAVYNVATDGDSVVDAAGNLLSAPLDAAKQQQQAARAARGHVQEYGDRSLGIQEGLADRGMQDYDLYRGMVQNDEFGTSAKQYRTGQYQPETQYNAPGFNQFQRGADPQFQAFQRGADPTVSQFQRGADPTFQRADAGNFQFDYQQSPGYQHALNQGLSAIEGRHSAQGSRFTGGADKDLIDYAGGMAAQDYGNQYARARGQFESDRGFGERQSGLENQYNMANYQFGAGMDQGELARQDAMRQGNYQFGTGVDVGQQNLMNQQNLANYQFGTGVDVGQSNLANQANMQNYWQGQQMGMDDRQFANQANMQANLQNYNMQNQQNQQRQAQYANLAAYGPQSQQNLANLTFDQGTALGNAELGVGNANAARTMAPYNTGMDLVNAGTQIFGAVAGA